MTDQPALPLATITEATAYFEKHGMKRDRSRIQRFVAARPHLIRGYSSPATERGPLVDPSAVLAEFKGDYTRQIHSGEASGLRSTTDAHETPQQSLASFLGQQPAPPAGTPADSPAPIPPESAGEDPQKQKVREEVRKRRRENAEAEGLLAPVDEIYAVLADVIPEVKSAFARIRQKHAEKLAAELNLPDAAVSIASALQGFEAAGFNRLADLMAARTTRDDPVALTRFEALVDHAFALREADDVEAVYEEDTANVA